MQSRSLSRELALLALGQIPEGDSQDLQTISLETLMQKVLDGLMQYWREGLDDIASELENANQNLIDSESAIPKGNSNLLVKEHLRSGLIRAQEVLNNLSTSLEISHLLFLRDQEEVRKGAINRAALVIEKRDSIDSRLDGVMEGWRLRRLPRIDRDILRLAVVDLIDLNTPAAVACNEAVELAHRYSDDQGRRMINGVLRRLQDASSRPIN